MLVLDFGLIFDQILVIHAVLYASPCISKTREDFLMLLSLHLQDYLNKRIKNNLINEKININYFLLK